MARSPPVESTPVRTLREVQRVLVARDLWPRARVVNDQARARIALSVWGAVVLIGAAAVSALIAEGHNVAIGAPPLHATWEPVVGAGSAGAVAAGALVFAGSRAAAYLPWRRLLVTSSVAAGGWAVAVSAIRGGDRLVAPLRSRFEYSAAVPRIHDVGDFLATFVDRLPSYPVHVQGHPPALVVALRALRDLGLTSDWWPALAFIAGGALAVPAVLVAARDVAGEANARRAAPFLVLAPAVIWLATSADALYTGVTAWGVALVIVATGRQDRRGDLAATAGGVLLGLGIFCSYGLVLVAIVPLTVAASRRRVRPVLLAAAGGGVVVLAFLVAGFWWLDGLLATRARYVSGVASRRPYGVFLVSNLAAFAIALGPAAAVGLARLRDRRLWLLVGAGVAIVALADLGGMSKGEVERIWLPFVPWMLLAAAAAAGPRRPGVLLAAQEGTTILVESLVRTPW